MNETDLTGINDFVGDIVCPRHRSHIEVFDPELKGFYCDLLRSGRKSYRLRYRINGKLRVVTLGDANYVTAEQARSSALKLLGQVRQGIDPSLKAGGTACAGLDGGRVLLSEIFALRQKL